MTTPTETAGGRHVAVRLTAAQEAAVAKLAYAAEHAGAIALLCGPAGVGKTMLLRRLARAGLPRAVGIRFWDAGEGRMPHAGEPGGGAADLLLVDHADRATAAELVECVESWWRRRPGSAIVLAGQGRLLSLCIADHRLERRVLLRATLPAFTRAESRRLLAPMVADAGGDDVLDTIHEIAAGAPAAALRLAEMAAVLAVADPGRRLVPDDVEAIHRRLCMHAA